MDAPKQHLTPGVPRPPQRAWPARWMIPLAVSVAAAFFGGGLLVGGHSRHHETPAPLPPASAPLPTEETGAGGAAVPPSHGPLYTSITCTTWRGVQQRLDTVPLPPAGWQPNSEVGRAAIMVWSAAIDPILADLAAVGGKPSTPAPELLINYVAAQRASIEAAERASTGGAPISTETQGQVVRTRSALDAVCGRR